MRAPFLAFEGPEGAGKSTQVRRLAEALRARGLEPLVTREPGGTPLGDRLRSVVLDASLAIAPLPEFLIYTADRAQHVADVIRPALDAGRPVITDRFSGASWAYQGAGRGVEAALLRDLTARATGGLEPDATLLLDLDPAEGLARAAARGAPDRLEGADLAFHERVRRGFLELAAERPSWTVLDATLPVDELARLVEGAVAPLFAAGASAADARVGS